MLYKNAFRKNMLIRFFPLAWYELRKYVFMIFFNNIHNRETKTFGQLKKVMKNKRKQIKELTKIDSQAMLKWIK